MLKLSSNSLSPLGELCERESIVGRITENTEYPSTLRTTAFLLVRNFEGPIPSGFAGYLFFERPCEHVPRNSFLLEPAFSYLAEGDIVKIAPRRTAIRVLYRRNSSSNALLMTERCNSFCLMCSQPPKTNDDSYLVADALQAIPLMSPETRDICLTGGETSLLGPDLARIVHCLKVNLPSTGVHILSNGRAFKDWSYAKSISEIHHADLMVGVPIYSDISSIHDYVVQAAGAFSESIRGVINLKSVGIRVEIRVVLHKLTYERLPDLARFIRRNLTFCDHVALMGLELTGFTKVNFDKLWIDPKDYQPQLKEAVEMLAQARMNVSIYNHQLCVLDPPLYPYNRRSISDWKNEYMPECNVCSRKAECGGFFSSAMLAHSAHIKPFRDKA
jgi:His-Xaa-Ser system radical SAM maturase HxsC